MEGAVLFGIEPSTINIRKSKYTIGLATEKIWDEKKYSKKGKKIFNEWMNMNCFGKFFEINQDIKLDEKIT